MSLKRAVIFSILSVSALVAYASAINDTIRFDDGGWYTGQIADSLFNGYGKMVYADSTVYEGEWKDGLWEGNGELHFPDGDSYIGEFKEHEFSGYGKYRYADGALYDGYWEHGMFNGSGTMTYADSSIYAGEWTDDRKNGTGVFYDAYTGALMKGKFRDDMFIGPYQSNQSSALNNNNDFGWNDLTYTNNRPDSCWHWKRDTYVYMTYGMEHLLSLHVDFYTSKRFYAGFQLGFNTAAQRIGEVSVTYDDETGEKITLVGWDWYLDEIMTEKTYTMFKLAAECGVSWGWFSVGTAMGLGLRNTIRNCRSLEHNDSYYEANTLYYREKVTGVKFGYDIYTDFLVSRHFRYLNSCSLRAGYSNLDGIYIGAGLSF